jgi:hypothetical protein
MNFRLQIRRSIHDNISRPRIALVTAIALSLSLFALLLPSTSIAGEENAAAIEKRIGDSVKYLASDELEGRGVGTKGLEMAADYIAAEFASMGLKTDLFDGSPFQKFTITVATELGPKEQNRLTLIGPPEKEGGSATRLELAAGKDFSPLAIGGSGQFDAPLVFVGYGITANEHKYDEYAGLNVEGKVVLIIRKEPQQTNPHSVFNGTQASQYAPFSRKVANAFEHGAAAVILVNDNEELQSKAKAEKKRWQDAIDKLAEVNAAFKKIENPTPEQFTKHRDEVAKLAESIQTIGKRLDGDFDQVLNFQGAGGESSHRNTPVYFCSRALADRVVQASLGTDLATIEAEIDKDLKPRSAALTGWQANGESNVIHKQAEVKNVVAVLEGEGPHADETVVVGAHYDHLGMGGSGSLAPSTVAVHNGADDNASGTAVLLEVARRLAMSGKKPSRRIVFIAFTGEERGLLGSAKYVRDPLFPLERTVAMINMDMVGRLQDNKLTVFGTGTAAELNSLVDQLNATYGFKITKNPSGFGPSDHSSFYAKQIPVLHLFTGTHNDYHRPSDDFEKINVEGMRRIADFVTGAVSSLAQSDSRPRYIETKRPQTAGAGGDRPYLGSIPDFSQEVDGYALMGVTKDSPAEQSGMKSGDVIVKFGESKIGSLEDIDSALRKFKVGDKVPVVVKRDGKDVTLTVTLGAPR